MAESIVFNGRNHLEVDNWLKASDFIHKEVCHMNFGEGEIWWNGDYIKAPCTLYKEDSWERLWVIPSWVMESIGCVK